MLLKVDNSENDRVGGDGGEADFINNSSNKCGGELMLSAETEERMKRRPVLNAHLSTDKRAIITLTKNASRHGRAGEEDDENRPGTSEEEDDSELVKLFRKFDEISIDTPVNFSVARFA